MSISTDKRTTGEVTLGAQRHSGLTGAVLIPTDQNQYT